MKQLLSLLIRLSLSLILPLAADAPSAAPEAVTAEDGQNILIAYFT